MRRFTCLYLITFILAFCSIVYELILAQSLSAFLENTVLRYSVTIGLYMFSMGFGALLAEGKLIRNPVLTLLKVEIGLTVIGGFSVIFLHIFDMLHMPHIIFSLCAHGTIILIGVLTGLEIPLLMEIGKSNIENKVLAVDYLGAFCGTVIFAFVFYPRLGLIPSAFLIGSLNAMAGAALYFWNAEIVESDKEEYYGFLSVQTILLLIVGICWFYANSINAFFMNYYMG